MYTLEMNLPLKTYPIYIKKGLLCSIGEEIRKIYNNRKIAVITDSHVERLYGMNIDKSLKKEEFLIKKIVVEPGENSKSFSALERVCDELLEFGLSRDNLIVTIGGGVVGDLGGFAASIILRGVPFVQVPTSLLGQVDSSIGGKVAINSNRGKNLIGSFHHPEAVLIDPDLLHTLDERYLYDGMAEVIKYGAVKDESLFDSLLTLSTKDDLFCNMEEIVYTCCSIKRDLVQMDEKDRGERMLLNFGHTIGHGLEKYFNYQKYTHGEAISVGMYTITKNSEHLGITKAGTSQLIKEILCKYKLPYEMPSVDNLKLIDEIRLDKKNTDKGINLILLKNIGDGFIKKVETSILREYTCL